MVQPDPLRPFPGPESGLDQGTIHLGVIAESQLPWRINDSDNIVCLGPPGSGKTMVALLIAQQLRGRRSATYYTRKRSDLNFVGQHAVFNSGLRFDERKVCPYWGPVGPNDSDWHQYTIHNLCQEFSLQYSRTLLLDQVCELQELYGKYSSLLGAQVSFTHNNLKDALQKHKRSKYYEGPATVLDLISRSTKNTYRWARGQRMEHLHFHGLGLHVIHNIPYERVLRFIITQDMHWAVRYLQEHGPDDRTPLHYFFFDDLHLIATQTADRNSPSSFTEQLLLMDQSGARWFMPSQIPSDIGTAALSMAKVVIVTGSFHHHKDVTTITDALGLRRADAPLIHAIPPEQALIRDNRYGKPFRVHIARFNNNPAAPTHAPTSFLPGRVDECIPEIPLKKVRNALATYAAGTPKNRQEGLSPDARKLAMNVLTQPFIFLKERYDALGLSGSKAQRAKNELLNSNLVKPHTIAMKGRPPVLLEPLEKLFKLFGQGKPNWGKGSFLHAYGIWIAKQWLKTQDCTDIREEHHIKGKAIDATGRNADGLLFGVEVTLHQNNLIDNVERGLAAHPDFAALYVLCYSQKEARKAEKTIIQELGLSPYLDIIQVVTVAQWLKELKDAKAKPEG